MLAILAAMTALAAGQDGDGALCVDRQGPPVARIAACDRALAAAGDDIAIHAARAHALFLASRLDEAIAEFERIWRIQATPAATAREDFAWALIERGRRAYNGGDLPATRADFQRATEINPANARARVNFGAILEMQNDPTGLAVLTEGLALDPREVSGWRRRGDAYVKRREYRLAIDDFTEALRLQPGLLDGLQGRGYARYQIGDYAGAASDYSALIALKPNHDPSYRMRALARAKSGDMDAAVADWWHLRRYLEPEKEAQVRADVEEVLQQQPNSVPLLVFSAELYKRNLQYDLAIPHLARAAAADPGNAGLWRELGRALSRQQRFQEAVQAYDRAVALEPGNRQIQDSRREARRYAAEQRSNDPANRAQADMLGRLLTGAFTAAVGGNTTQVAQALAGQAVTAPAQAAPAQQAAPRLASVNTAPGARPSQGAAPPSIIRSRNFASCLSYAFQRRGVGKHIYRITSGCSEEVGYGFGVYDANGRHLEYQSSGGVLRPGQSEEVAVEMRSNGVKVGIHHACLTKAAAELSLGVRVETVQWRPGEGCLVFPLGTGAVGTAR